MTHQSAIGRVLLSVISAAIHSIAYFTSVVVLWIQTVNDTWSSYSCSWPDLLSISGTGVVIVGLSSISCAGRWSSGCLSQCLCRCASLSTSTLVYSHAVGSPLYLLDTDRHDSWTVAVCLSPVLIHSPEQLCSVTSTEHSVRECSAESRVCSGLRFQC